MADESHFMVTVCQFPKQPAIGEVVVAIQRREDAEYFVTVRSKYCRDEIENENCLFCHFECGRVRVAAQFVGY